MSISVGMPATATKLDVGPEFNRAEKTKTSIQLEFRLSTGLTAASGANLVEQPCHGIGRGLADADYRELDLTLRAEEESVWCFMRPAGPSSFTPTLLRELISVRRTLQRMFANLRPGEPVPIKYFVSGSRVPRIYNIGADLSFFTECVRKRNHEALRSYAHDWVDVSYHMTLGFHLPLFTIALVQGDAMGGGFEGALSCNVLVAEKSARFGLPEIVFSLFPGMGAFSFVSRKLDAAQARKMMFSGRSYSATELYDMGLVDVLAEDGQGEDAVRDYIAQHCRRHNVHRCIRDVALRVNPLSLKELIDIGNIWADNAMRLDESDLLQIERIAEGQARAA